jgi:DNA-binding ferritin-like protein
MSEPLPTALYDLWVVVQGEYWLFWALHWRAKGSGYYGLHLLYQKVYAERQEEIDRLAELIAALYGAEALRPAHALREAQAFVTAAEGLQSSDTGRGIMAVIAALRAAQAADRAAEGTPYAAGVHNVVGGIADKHLQALYLLQQADGGGLAAQRAARSAPAVPAFGDAGAFGDVEAFGELGSPGAAVGGYSPRTPEGHELGRAWGELSGGSPALGRLVGDALGLLPDGAPYAKTVSRALIGAGLLYGLHKLFKDRG